MRSRTFRNHSTFPMKHFVTAFLIVLSSLTIAQQEPSFSLFWNNYSQINPGATGANYKFHGAYNHFFQGSGVEDNPFAASINFERNFSSINSGIGIGCVVDKYAIFYSNKLTLSYAYQLDLNSDMTLGIGALGIMNRLITHWGTPYPYPLLKARELKFDFGLGVYLKAKKFEVGLSSTMINQTNYPVATYYSYLSVSNTRRFHLMGTYNIDLSEDIAVKPSLLLSTITGGFDYTLNTRIIYKDQIWIGASLKRQSAYAFQTGYNLQERINLAYSYSFVHTHLAVYLPSTHEFSVALTIGSLWE